MGLAKGFGLLALFISLGWVTAQLLESSLGEPDEWQNQAILYSGIAFLLWSAIGRAGHSIKTLGAETLPELVDEFIYTALNCVGTYLTVIAGTWNSSYWG